MTEVEQHLSADRAGSLQQTFADYRAVREEVESSILPLASSLDGSSFEFQASLHAMPYRSGGYVVLESPDVSRLGQVITLQMASQTAATELTTGTAGSLLIRLARGTGTVLDGDGGAFHDARLRPATSQEVEAWTSAQQPQSRAGLTIGEHVMAPGVPVTLDSGGFSRHTFVCGQSGSGKTYSLGLLLERILADTRLRVVVLDPNSDYVGLASLRDDADPLLAERYAGVSDDTAVWSDDDGPHRLRLRFRELDPPVQAALLGLDPIADREEYATLIDLLRGRPGSPLVTSPGQLLRSESREARRLGQRAANLGVLDWQIWDPQAPSLLGALRAQTHRCTVVDTGSLATTGEQRLVSEAVLSTLWDMRASRTPCLVVVDEAHNVLPAEPTDEVTRLSTERAVQIAAEGRKYGLHLLCSTQQPHKVQENVVAQCDNLVLMRMNSQGDVADLARLFSFVPDGLLSRATSFTMGQALVAGKLLPRPAFVQMGRRITREGGLDVSSDWAAPRH